LSVNPYPSKTDFDHALRSLRHGGIVAYPTETFYGLAVDPFNEQAVKALFDLKQRDKLKPISLIIPDISSLSTFSLNPPLVYQRLMSSFWPGPLTLLFLANNKVARNLTGEGTTIGARISSHPIATQLCSLWGGAITATSANVSGEFPLINARDVQSSLGERVSFVLDGGQTAGGPGSTIIHCTDLDKKCRIIREGGIKKEELFDKLPSDYIICKS